MLNINFNIILPRKPISGKLSFRAKLPIKFMHYIISHMPAKCNVYMNVYLYIYIYT
jgi:hypothetical protein